VNLSFDIHRLLPILAVGLVALAAAVLVARGVGGGSTAASAQQVLDRSLKEEPQSGAVNMRVNVTVDLSGKQFASQLVMTGAGANAAAGRPAQGQYHWSERAAGKAPAVHDEVAVGGRGYIGVDGRWYRVTPVQYKQLFDSAQGKPLFQSQGFDPRNWIKNPKLESTTSHVGGVQANQISGELDAQRVVDELGVNKGAGSLAAQVANAMRAAPKQGTINLFVGKQDGILRKVSVVAQADGSKSVPPLRLTLSFASGLDKVNQPVKVAEPARALPPARIAGVPQAKLGSRADKIFGPAAKPAQKPAPARGHARTRPHKPAQKPAPTRRHARTRPHKPVKPAQKPAPTRGHAPTQPQKPAPPARVKRSRQAYVGCVQAAQDLAMLERCQALLP
jgi:hypothetical protein